jgi:hypothetical protein
MVTKVTGCMAAGFSGYGAYLSIAPWQLQFHGGCTIAGIVDIIGQTFIDFAPGSSFIFDQGCEHSIGFDPFHARFCFESSRDQRWPEPIF